MQWDPDQYARYADERGRPFADLTGRIHCAEPRRVVDLGCGPGHLTAQLAARWPRSVVHGVDNSAEMIAAAPAGANLSFALGDIESWTMPADTDVIVSNAALQWVPSHLQLLARWAGDLPAGGWLAFQVPDQFEEPSHATMRALAASPRWADRLDGVLRASNPVATPAAYAELLLSGGLQVDVWETTYLHVLAGPDPVLEWLRGTGLRPVTSRLDAADAAGFEAEFGARLRELYPPTPHGTVLPYRRIFAVGHKPA